MTWHSIHFEKKLTRYIQYYKSQNALYVAIEKLLSNILRILHVKNFLFVCLFLSSGPCGGGNREGGPEVWEWSVYLLRRVCVNTALFWWVWELQGTSCSANSKLTSTLMLTQLIFRSFYGDFCLDCSYLLCVSTGPASYIIILGSLLDCSLYSVDLCVSVRVCLQCTSLQCQASVTLPGIPLIQLRLQARPATVPTTLSELSPTCRSFGCVGNKCRIICSTNQENSLWNRF